MAKTTTVATEEVALNDSNPFAIPVDPNTVSPVAVDSTSQEPVPTPTRLLRDYTLGFKFDEDHIVIETIDVQLNPISRDHYLIPEGYEVPDEYIPEHIEVLPEGYAYKYFPEQKTWDIIANHKGKTIYNIETLEESIVDYYGDIKAGFTLLKPETKRHTWNNEKKEWELTKAAKEALRLEECDSVWEKIKQHRYEVGNGGIYIERVGKWFHTGEEEKPKYLGLLATIDMIPSEIHWTTMDNSFVVMTKELLQEILLSIVATENHNHVVALKHKEALYKSKDPLKYDFSGGWSAVFGN